MSVQSGRQDQAILDDMERYVMSRAIGFTYLYLTRPVLETFGKEGEKAIRQGVRAFGKHRGERIGRWHEEENIGHKNIESLISYWDILSVKGCGTENPGVAPYIAEWWARHCPLHDVCREDDFERWGYIYCDEMHYEAFAAYNPKITVEIHECLMKGDDGCHFRANMYPEIPEDDIDKTGLEALGKRITENQTAFQRLMLQREGSLIGMLYFHIAKAVIERFGRESRSVVESTLIEMARRRGQELKKKIEKTGLETTWENIWDQFDLGYKYGWQMQQEDIPDKRLFVGLVGYCPMNEVWREMGDKELGPLFCHTQYRVLFKELNPAAEINIHQCMSEGASACRFEFQI
jgi:hypothetical protein